MSTGTRLSGAKPAGTDRSRRAWLLASIRGGVGIGLPLLCGTLTGHRSAGMLAALGALWAVSQDGVDPSIRRIPRVALIASTSAVGLAAGIAVRDQGTTWPVWILLAGVAVVAGYLETGRPMTSAAGMHLLLGAVVGSGLTLPGRWWQPPLALLGGAAFVAVLAVIAAPGGVTTGRRQLVAEAFGSLAAAFEALGDPGALEARRRLVAAFDEAEDVILPLRHPGPWRRVLAGTPPGDAAALVRTFDVGVRLGEVSSALTADNRPVPDAVSQAMRLVAAVLVTSRWRQAFAEAWTASAIRLEDVAGDDPLIGHLVALLETASRDGLPTLDLSHRRPGAPAAERVRFAALLAAAVLAAAVLAHALHGDRAYWLPVSVAFIFRPDLGPVLRRGLARTVGTAAGAGLASLLGLVGSGDYALPAVAAACGVVMPLVARRSYAVSVAVFTPIVFVFLDLVGSGHGLLLTRIEDTALAAVIALAADLAVWSHAPFRRSDAAVGRAEAAVASYAERSGAADPSSQHLLRRQAFRSVADARAALDRDAAELGSRRHPSSDATERLAEAEHRIDRVSRRLLLSPP